MARLAASGPRFRREGARSETPLRLAQPKTANRRGAEDQLLLFRKATTNRRAAIGAVTINKRNLSALFSDDDEE